MRTDALICYEAVVRHRSFRDAAAELDLSQPALSQQIKKLEDDLGIVLFYRGKGGTRATAAGLQLLPYAKAVISSESALRQEAGALQSVRKGLIRIGVTWLASQIIMEKAVIAFHGSHPGVGLQVTERGSHEIERMVSRGVLDAGVVGGLKSMSPDPGLNSRVLVVDELVACVPIGHPLSDREEIDASAFLDEPLIMYDRGHLLHEVGPMALGGTPKNVVYFTNSTDTALRLVEAGIGIALVPSLALASRPDHARARTVWLTQPRLLTLNSIWRSSTPLAPAVKTLLDLFAEGAKNLSVARDVRR